MWAKNRTWSRPTRGLGALLLVAGAFAASAQTVVMQSAVPAQVEYHQATDVFNVLDNIPDWLPGYTDPAYGEYWEKHVGLDQADRAAMRAYADFRQRTAPAANPTTTDAAAPDLFAPVQTRDVDGLARFFIEARDFKTGAKAAVAAQPPSDRAMLRKYYARFGPRALRLLSTQSRFEIQRAALATQLAQPGVARLAGQIRQFYGVDTVPPFVARFLWWPEAGRSQAKVRGSMILLQGPADGAGGDPPMDWAPIVLHEYAHHVSAGQAQAQRQRLSAAYLRGCPAATTLPNPLNAFEEPLAIYWGQYRFEQEVRGRALPVDGKWYFKPMPDRIAKAIAMAFPATGLAPLLDDPGLMQAATSACRETMKEAGK